MVCHALALRFIKLGQKVKNARHTLTMNSTPTDTLTAYANLFGEMVYFEKIEALMPDDFKSAANTVMYDSAQFDPLREQEIAGLKLQLKKLHRLGKESSYLYEYTAVKKKGEIREIEKKLDGLGAFREDKS